MKIYRKSVDNLFLNAGKVFDVKLIGIFSEFCPLMLISLYVTLTHALIIGKFILYLVLTWGLLIFSDYKIYRLNKLSLLLESNYKLIQL